jgi:hypothetical protein
MACHRLAAHDVPGAEQGVRALVVLAGPAAADDPLYLNWATELPALASEYDPSALDDCRSGRLQCVDKVIREMTRRFDDLADDCDHDALFSLAYLRTTEEYKRAAETPGFFEDTSFVNFEDAVFARYYFEAYDAWHAGDAAATPPAWRVALEAADDRAVDASTNVLLGISAHINRDLPFVLWEIGLVKPDGTSRKTDHDKVNDFLARVLFYSEAKARFDPSLPEDGESPGAINLVVAWREQAWRNAERLAAAEHDPVQLALVKASIEEAAHAEALALRSSGSYGVLESSASRDAYCAAQRDA